MSRYFRLLYAASVALACFMIAGCCCPRPYPTACCQAMPCAPACAPHACCAQPVCPKFYPLNPGTYSQTMHTAISADGAPFLIPQSELKTIMTAP